MTDRSFRVKASRDKGVLLIHGLSGTPLEMKYLAKKLFRRGFTVHVPQLAGHGVDQAALLKTTWRDWYASVETAYRELAAEVRHVYVAGICVGGGLAVALAAHERVEGVGVYSMTFIYDGWNMTRWVRSAPLLALVANLPYLRSLRFEEPYPYGLKDERIRARVADAADNTLDGALSHLSLGSLYQMHWFGRYVSKVAPKVVAPTLLLHAREDDMSSPNNAFKLRNRLGGAVDLRFLDDCYHMIHVDRSRDLVADMTADFFGAPLAAEQKLELAHA